MANLTGREKLYDLIVDAENEFYKKHHYAEDSKRIESVVDRLIDHGVTVKQMQKPLTVEEVRKKDVVYLDERHGRTSVPCFIDPASTEHDMYFFTGLSCVFTHRVKSYNKFWRCWAEKPTEAEREAAEWEK